MQKLILMQELMQELADDPPPLLRPETEMAAGHPTLSPREAQIVRHVLSNEKEQTIAAKLDMSSHTVHTHLRRLYAKLGVSSRVELVERICNEYVVWIQQGGLPHKATAAFTQRRAAA